MKDINTSYLRKLTQLFYDELTDCSVVIDSRPAWHNIDNIKMYKDIFGELPKIICPVRNVEEIAASFVSLFRNNGRNWHSHDMKDLLLQNCQNLKSTKEFYVDPTVGIKKIVATDISPIFLINRFVEQAISEKFYSLCILMSAEPWSLLIVILSSLCITSRVAKQ